MNRKSTIIIPLFAGILLVACLLLGLWRFFEQNPFSTLSEESTDPAQMGDIPEPEYKATIGIGEAFDHTPTFVQGVLRCTVTNPRLVTQQKDCPPRSWFVDPLTLIGEDGRAQCVDYDQWFAPGGAIDQGCAIVIVDVLIENISAVGIPPEEGGHEDPYCFDVYNLLDLADTALLREDTEQSWYQGYICIGSDIFEKNQALEDKEQQYVRIEQGQSVTVQICFPVCQNDDRTPKDVQKLVLVTDSTGYTNQEYLIPLGLSRD